MIAFQVNDMTSHRSAGAVARAVKEADPRALVRVDMATFTIEIEECRASARELRDAIEHAGYSPIAA
jgi:copper chaperone